MNDREHYINLHKQLHEQSTLHFAGKSLRKYIEEIDLLCQQYNCLDILDYGCGKANFWPDQWQGRVVGYDPAYEKFNTLPKPADMVICVDVMEHIPESEVPSVLKHISTLSKKWSFFAIDTKKAKKKFLDGTNCHITIKSPEWWQEQLNTYCPTHTLKFEKC